MYIYIYINTTFIKFETVQSPPNCFSGSRSGHGRRLQLLQDRLAFPGAFGLVGPRAQLALASAGVGPRRSPMGNTSARFSNCVCCNVWYVLILRFDICDILLISWWYVIICGKQLGQFWVFGHLLTYRRVAWPSTTPRLNRWNCFWDCLRKLQGLQVW